MKKVRTQTKKLLSLLLAVVLMVSTVALMQVSATSKTVDEAMNWCESQINKTVGTGQCVALIQAYYSYLGVSGGGGNAKDYTTNSLPSGFTRVKGGVPQRGDILVYIGATYGHVAIYAGGTVSYHQNMAGEYVEKKTSWAYNNSWYSSTENGTKSYWGYIRPNFSTGISPVGTIDSCVGGVGYVTVGGWAFDEDNTSTSINIDVYIGGPAGTPNLSAHRIKADRKRSDVNNAYNCGEYHGYEATLDTGLTGTQSIYIYAINIGSGDNVLLGERTVSITDPNPDGMLDSCDGGSGFVHIRGWAADADDYSKSLNIHLYIGADVNAGTGEAHNDIYANTLRADVDNAYHIGKYHGFDAKIPTSRVGNQTVYVYAINIGRGNFKLIGSKTVYISQHTHSYTSRITTASTCTADGLKTYTCSCGSSYTEKINKLGHNYGAWTQLNDTQHQRICSRDKNHIEKANHTWDEGEVSKAATCIATGIKTYTCSVCKGIKTASIPVNASNHINTKNISAIVSSCTVKGYTAGVYCNDCKKYISGHAEQPLAAHQTTVINAKEATYDADGYTGDTYCIVCKQTIEKGAVISKLSKPDEPITPTNPTQPTQPDAPQPQLSGTCRYCGQSHTGFPGILIGFFHSILALFGLRK